MAKDRIVKPFLYVSKDQYRIDNIEDMKGVNFALGDVVDLLGYYEAGDGAHHKRKVESTDDGSGVQLVSGLWANVVHDGEVNVSWFGAKGDGVTDDSLTIQKALDFSRVVNLDSERYICRSKIYLNPLRVLKSTICSIVNYDGVPTDDFIELGDFSKVCGFVIIADHFFSGSLISHVPHESAPPKNNFYQEITKGNNTLYIRTAEIENMIFQKKGTSQFPGFTVGNLEDIRGSAVTIFSTDSTDKNYDFCWGAKIKGCHFSGTFYNGIMLKVEETQNGSPWIHDTVISNNTFEHTKRAISIERCSNVIIEKCFIQPAVVNDGTGTKYIQESIYLNNSNSVSITKTYVWDYQNLIDETVLRLDGECLDVHFDDLFERNSFDSLKRRVKIESQKSLYSFRYSVQGKSMNFGTTYKNNKVVNYEFDTKNTKILENDKNTFHSIPYPTPPAGSCVQIGYFDLKSFSEQVATRSIANLTVFESIFTSLITKDFVAKNTFRINDDFSVVKFYDTLTANVDDYNKTPNYYYKRIFDSNQDKIFIYIDQATSSQNVNSKNLNFITHACFVFETNTSFVPTGDLTKVLTSFPDKKVPYLANMESIKTRTSSGEIFAFAGDKKIYWNCDGVLYNSEGVQFGTFSTEKLDTPYYTSKMQQEGVYEDFTSYMDEQHEYKKRQRELEEKRQEAFDSRESADQSYEDWLSTQPQLMPFAEPQPSQALLDFKKKYLG